MRNPVGKEGFAVRIDEPRAVVDLGQADIGLILREGGRWCGTNKGECEHRGKSHGGSYSEFLTAHQFVLDSVICRGRFKMSGVKQLFQLSFAAARGQMQMPSA